MLNNINDMVRTMEANASIMVFSDAQEQARRRRNRSITLMLFGIIFLFLLCHVGEVSNLNNRIETDCENKDGPFL